MATANFFTMERQRGSLRVLMTKNNVPFLQIFENFGVKTDDFKA